MRVLAPVERTEELEGLLRRVGLLFAGTGTRVILLAVGAHAAGLREALRSEAASLEALGVDVMVVSASGAPSEAIVRSARRYRADLVLLSNGPFRPAVPAGSGDGSI